MKNGGMPVQGLLDSVPVDVFIQLKKKVIQFGQAVLDLVIGEGHFVCSHGGLHRCDRVTKYEPIYFVKNYLQISKTTF